MEYRRGNRGEDDCAMEGVDAGGHDALWYGGRWRFRRVAAMLAMVVALGIAGALGACATGGNGGDLEVAPAFGERYEIVEAAAHEANDDAKLFLVRQQRLAEPGTVPAWEYLYLSRDYGSVFSLTLEGDKAMIGDNAFMPLTEREFSSIASIDGIAYDADTAYELVRSALAGEPEVRSCLAYLMTYVPEDEDPTAAALKWFFLFNPPEAVERDYSVVEEPAAEAEPAADSFAYSVDAVTGEVAPSLWKRPSALRNRRETTPDRGMKTVPGV